MAETGKVKLIWSFMHEDETILCPFPDRKYEVLRLSALCKLRVGPEDEVFRIAKSLQERAGISAKDAVHLACAIHLKADFFLTCDNPLIRHARPLNLEVIVMNPVDYISKEVAE